MAGGHVARIASAVHERLSFTRLQRLHDDLRLVPAIASGTCREGKQHGLSARQHLGAVRELTVLDADQTFLLAAVRRDAHHALAALTEHNPVDAPAHAE